MRFCAAVVIVLLAGCRPASSDHRTPDFDAAFQNSVDAYAQYVLPNSMARPEGTDLDALQKQRLQRFEKASKVLHSAAGVAFMRRRLSKEADDLVVICGITVLGESEQPEARDIIRRYSVSPNAMIAEHANAALAKLTGAR